MRRGALVFDPGNFLRKKKSRERRKKEKLQRRDKKLRQLSDVFETICEIFLIPPSAI
jgi:hypothetical protein